LQGGAGEARSLFYTLFLDVKLLKNFIIKFNPEMADVSGLSQARGLGGFSNGETFRIGNPSSALFVGATEKVRNTKRVSNWGHLYEAFKCKGYLGYPQLPICVINPKFIDSYKLELFFGIDF